MPTTTPLTDEQRQSILDMHAEGATRRDIATAHGVSPAVVSKVVHAAGRVFAGNHGTRAATLTRQLDLADWHDQRAAELEAREGPLLDRMLVEPVTATATFREWQRVTEAAQKHRESAARMRYAATLRDMPDENWPHLLAMAELASARGDLGKGEQEAIAAEFRRRAPGLSPLIRAQIDYELSRVR